MRIEGVTPRNSPLILRHAGFGNKPVWSPWKSAEQHPKQSKTTSSIGSKVPRGRLCEKSEYDKGNVSQ